MKKIITMSTCVILVVSSLLFSGCKKEDKLSLKGKEKEENIKLKKEQDNKDNYINIGLYFDSSKDGKKSEITKEERLLNKDEVLGEVIIQQLIKGPAVRSELKPILPKGTRLISFSIADKIATINFSSEIVVPMSAEKEETCLKAIVSSLSEIPSVEKVRIQVENKNIDTIGGNYSITEPFSKSEVNFKKKD
ncbi:GerMN domain-containing protein [Hathewaya massiliensis]|uniref:GerMN domain-containing protein n=1 Tax=Hathewaya massiliensis TaxID=1964382 RepID=UPI0011598086|nr:GerMN domain-containing protein [Hathewaya massiliensis]